MIEISHFNRDPRPSNFTFEQLFGALRTEFAKSIKVHNYDLPEGLNKFQAILWANKKAGKINHITGDVNYLAYGLPKNSLIITVHDIGHYTRFLKGWEKYFYKKFWLEGPFKKAARITAISNFTKNELIQKLGVPESKIKVIHNPVLPGIEFNKPRNNSKPVILQVGSGSNKNVMRLVEAVKDLDVKLLLINKLWDPKIRKALMDYKIDFEALSELSLKELNDAYSKCDILFFASEYEGFGLPILEAQSAGRPVLTSNITAMPEVAGKNGAVFIDPFDVDQIREGLISIISSESLRASLIQNGLDNIKKFQINEISKKYLSLYHEMS